MNVTLILGNGFDLNMGLPTAYSDFYQYYLKVDSPIQADFIKQKIKDEPKTWADLEKALGDVTAEYSDKVSVFDAAFSNVRDALAKYLEAVDTYAFPGLNANAFRFLQNVLEIDRFLDNKPKREYREFIKELDYNDIVLNVINFNYTSVVEKLKEVVSSAQVPNKKVVLNDIIHVHQTLDAGIIMGVNDESQIANETFRKSFDIQSVMIKPFINEEFAAGNDAKCVQLIANSDIIILYGTSLGQTDQVWWNVLANNVLARRQRIVYCPYESGAVQPMHETNVIRKIRYFKGYLAKTLVSDNVSLQAELMDKIYPIRNNHMFNFGFTQKDRDAVRREVIHKLIPPHYIQAKDIL